MPQFRYMARDAEGKFVDGVITSNDRAAAIRQVEQQRFVPIKIEMLAGDGGAPAAKAPAPAKAKGSAKPSAKSGAKPAGKEPGAPAKAASESDLAVQTMSYGQQYLFTEQLAHLLTAGMTLDEALSILERRLKHPRLHGLSHNLHRALVDGRSLSQALRDYPKIFSPLYVNMVAAGEASGALADIMKRLVAHLSEMKALRDRVQQALLYPALLVLAGFGMIIVFMTKMVPTLTGFLKSTGAPLPGSTQILIKANEFLTSYWWMILLALVIGFMGFKSFTRSEEGKRQWDALAWRIPLYSYVTRYRFYAQFARTLGTLIQNGVTLLRALELLEGISGNEFVRQRMSEVRRAVIDGATLSTALAEQNLFPELFIDMMAVGEQTGRFGETMQNIANIYERELDKQVKIISTLLPPLVMLAVASIVGVVVYGIMNAVFGLTSGLQTGRH